MMTASGMIAVDKMGTKVLFLNPISYETEIVLDGFQRPCTNCWWCRKPASPMCRSSATASTAAIPTRSIISACST